MATDEDDWRAQREAALIGTPFARPREPVPDPTAIPGRDRTDDTLPIQRGEPTVSIRPQTTSAAADAPTGTPAGPAAAAPKAASASPRAASHELSRPSATRSLWWLIAAGAAIIVVALVWLTERDRTAPVRTVAPAVVRPAPLLRPAPLPRTASVTTAVVPPSPAVSTATDIDAAASDPTIVAIPTPRLRSEGRASPAVAGTRAPTQRKPVQATDASRKAAPVATGSALPVITVSSSRCSASSTHGELAVCASPVLTAKAREERQLFDDVVASGDARAVAKAQKDQASLIKRRDRCKNDACIGRAYERQIATLQKMQKKAAQAQVRAAEKLLPRCAKAQRPAPGVCRSGFSLKRLLGL